MKSARCLHIWSPRHQIDRKKRLVTRATHCDFMFHQKCTLLLKSEPPLLGGHIERTNVLEIAVNSREFQRIVVLVLFLSSTFQTPFIGKSKFIKPFEQLIGRHSPKKSNLHPKVIKKYQLLRAAQQAQSTFGMQFIVHRREISLLGRQVT